MQSIIMMVITLTNTSKKTFLTHLYIIFKKGNFHLLLLMSHSCKSILLKHPIVHCCDCCLCPVLWHYWPNNKLTFFTWCLYKHQLWRHQQILYSPSPSGMWEKYPSLVLHGNRRIPTLGSTVLCENWQASFPFWNRVFSGWDFAVATEHHWWILFISHTLY